MAKPTICNWCEKVIINPDVYTGVSIHTTLGYGAEFDGGDIDFDLCPECTKEFIKLNDEKCKISMLRKRGD